MVETVQIACPVGVYTALSTGQANVSFRPALIYGGRMIIATSQPIPGATNFVRVHDGEVSLGSLGASDKVYWMPDVAETIAVIRG
ncbi:MAG: hypothetical protein JWR80_8033 [Bradyrhizobium sp.]|nr:hypothetical protein [Bradyrhizobium sp.]